ncbi:MAG: Fe-S-containing protein [Acidobacteriota bacterium]|nr:Fe-S-containing protein [Acidobacteriota bacterium]
MLQTFTITLREGVEAALVISIAVAYLRKTGRMDLMPAVYRALVSAVFACFFAAWGFSKIGLNDDAYEGWTLLISAIFVFTMVLWMNRHGGRLKGEIESRLQKDAAPGAGSTGIFLFVFLMIFREGVETVLMLYGALKLDTSGILEATGALLGVALAVLFGVSFVRGTIRVNLKQFFQMTTVILMVVVVQLAITGLHELSESRVLPSSSREMAIVGPVVKNDIFFFVTILALAAAMMLLEWRKRRGAAAVNLEGAALRKAQWSARRERLWMIASCTACCVFILLITAQFVYARQATALSTAQPVVFENGAVRIPVASVSDGILHRYELQDQGIGVRFIVIERPDHSIATAFDACEICGTQGFYQKGPEVICRNCGSGIVTSTIGTRGGCNPIPLKSRIEAGVVVIDEAALEPGVGTFRKGKA